MKVHVAEPLPRLRAHIEALVQEVGAEVAPNDACDVLLVWHDARQEGWNGHVDSLIASTSARVVRTGLDEACDLRRPFRADDLLAVLTGEAPVSDGAPLGDAAPQAAVAEAPLPAEGASIRPEALSGASEWVEEGAILDEEELAEAELAEAERSAASDGGTVSDVRQAPPEAEEQEPTETRPANTRLEEAVQAAEAAVHALGPDVPDLLDTRVADALREALRPFFE